jgi:eukaryotic-like serine/threonine-protein kinase
VQEPTPDLDGLPRPGDLLAEKYRIERVIGIGGMGAVFEAHHVHLDQRVAIKMLLPELATDPDVVRRFLREGRAAVKIPSQHVARVQDVSTLPDGTPFMVMELLQGADLQGVLDARGPLPVPLAVDYLLQTCEALAHAHAMGIVHRDLKPPNLFITGSSTLPVVKLLDFGISKLPTTGDLTMTKTRAVMGSPVYMAPEQMRSARRVDARADIWGLGTLLYTMLSGRPPFESDTMPELCAMIVSDPTPNLHDRRAGVPSALVRAIEHCLEKDPERRFASVAELARVLAPFASEQGRAMLPRIEAASLQTLPLVATSPESTGSGRVAAALPIARTGSAWGANSRNAPRGAHVRSLVWALGGALALAALAFGVLTFVRRSPAPPPVASPSPSASSPVVAPPAPSPGPAIPASSLVSLAEPSSVPAEPLATSSAAPSRRRTPPRAAHSAAPAPVPLPSSPPPPRASQAPTDSTPPGWTSGRKD